MSAENPDLAIAQAATLQPITEIAETAGVPAEALVAYGSYKAKVDVRRMTPTGTTGKLVLVSAMSPTPAGEGKSTTTVGLADAFSLQGHRTMVALREPALGPIMGIKGGATGGGYAQVVPMEDINLHFTGDFHAIQIANNTLAALVDNHLHQGNALGIDPRRIQWKRVVDVNDRALRKITIGLGGPTQGVPREDGFDIVVASEIMAVLCLSTDLQDLEARIDRIVVGFTYDRAPVTVADLGVGGAVTMLLKDALLPNLVQTLGGTPALVHGGPFANIAHGCNSLAATRLALSLADITVTEAGLEAVLGWATEHGFRAALSEVWAKGGEGGLAVAEQVLAAIEQDAPDFHHLYDPAAGIEESLRTLAREIYGADDVVFEDRAPMQLRMLQRNGWDTLPVCVAKTQYSFSDDPTALGAPTGHVLHVRDLVPKIGAGFVVALTGSIMTMPGLPREPAALRMGVTEAGESIGLF